MTEQLTEMSDADLVGKVVELEREIVTARFAHSMGKLENTASLKVVRRAVARLQYRGRGARAMEVEPRICSVP